MFNWLKKWAMDVFDLQMIEPIPSNDAQIWSIIEGARRAEDLDDEELDGLDVSDTAVRLILKISVDSTVFDIEAWFENYDEAKHIIDHFNKSISPLPMNLGEFHEYD
jgi:hypothetical protein